MSCFQIYCIYYGGYLKIMSQRAFTAINLSKLISQPILTFGWMSHHRPNRPNKYDDRRDRRDRDRGFRNFSAFNQD